VKFSKPRRWPTDPLWGTGHKVQKLYCDCAACLAKANAASQAGKKKGKRK